MDEVFAAYMQAGLRFPTATKTRKGEYRVSPPAETVAKAALYVALAETDISKSAAAR